MSCPTATPASKRHCNQQPSALMPPASQVTSVTSPPGTISHFFGSMFCTTSLFCHEFHNDDDHGDPNTLNTDGSPILSPPPPIFLIQQTVLYIKQVHPVPVLILDTTSTEPSLL